MISRLARNLLAGMAVSGASGRLERPVLEITAKTVVTQERHQFQESIELLNAMRRVGGVRPIASGTNDNGAPIGQISERVMRHVNFEALNSHIQNDTEFDYHEAPQWGQYGPAVVQDPPIQRLARPSTPPATARAAEVEVHRPKYVRTLQEELFGS